MTEEEIQAAIDALQVRISEWGAASSEVSVKLECHIQPMLIIKYRPERGADSKYEFIRGGSVADVLAQGEAFIAALPDKAQAKRDHALALIAKALEAARDADIDAQAGTAYVAQLEAMMKALSENALTDRREAAQ